MKRIGIITMTNGQNYGNKLQNYAVQEVLKKLGFEPITIINTTKKGFDYSVSFSGKIKKLNPLYIVKVIRTRIKNKLYIKNDNDNMLKSYQWKKRYNNEIRNAQNQRVKVFSYFFNHNISHSRFTISVNNLNKSELNQFDYFVCGSDQIWNPYYPQNSSIDFLQFAPIEKRIAYAPSFGINHIPENRKEIYTKWLNEIPHLSVREEKGAKIIKELTGRKVGVLVDPTMMLSAAEWLSVSKKPDFVVPDKYILTYFLGNQTKKYNRFIKQQAKELNCKTINLNEIREFEHYTVDPSGFIYLINHAKIICTDSFHGTVLSIVLKKNFVVFNRVEDGHSMGSRIETLLKKFGLEKRLFRNLASDENLLNVDFNCTESIIREEQDKTIEYLTTAFNK